ncbi:MAG TPA: hypothetical protein ENG87_00825 [Candidatus Pacearchaeota archaeon]|nr:hypothetical protein [Candidatus Pacearchaeota archaeon]
MNKPKVKEISPTLFKVLNHSVKLQKRKGRLLLLCSCTNSSYFANNNFCYHKQLVFEYINLKDIRSKINKLIEFYEGQKEINMQINPDIILNDLNNLR